MQDVADAVRVHLREEHGDLFVAVEACADAVAGDWADDWTADRSRVVDSLRAELEARGLLARFPAVLADAVAAAGFDLSARPVAAPPYVIVTGRGPVLRATVAAGRLVIRVAVFSVEREPEVRYVRGDGDPLAVEFRR